MQTQHVRLSSIGTRSLLVVACAAAVLAACGGGGSSASSPSPTPTPTPTQTSSAATSGTVTGFGSLIVDGVRIDNHAVGAMRELEDGTLVSAELRLGKHVEVLHDDNLVASQVRVRAEVEGTVQAVDVTAKTLKVLDQTIAINTDATLGPVTVFDNPYTALADVKLADNVEIHALLKLDAAGKASLQATRIEKKVADAFDRVHGIVAELSTSAHTFKLGALLVDYTDAKLLPQGIVLANGAEVHVSISAGAATPGTAAKAKVIKVSDRKHDSDGKEAELGGAIGVLDATAKSFSVDGVKVDASAATFKQAGKSFADLKLGTYVVVKGSYASDQSLKASSVVIRAVDDEKGNEIELHGSILDFTSLANFTVRGVTVDASSAKIDVASCAGVTVLVNNLQVEVTGSLTATGIVKASTLKCEKAQDGVTVLGRHGVASKIDLVAKTLTLTTEKETLTVQWSAATTFVKVDASAVDGKSLSIEGTLSAGVFHAEKIVLTQK